MRMLGRIFLGLIVIILIVVVGGYYYLQSAFPKVEPAADIKVDSSPAAIERGKYLANHVTVCIDCHSTREWSLYAGPVVPGTEGMGGEKFGEEMGLPGTMISKNITPAGIGDWTDGEILRTITTGVTKTNEPLFPIMPYLSYSMLDPEDAHAIVAYLRTLSPIEHTWPETELNFPLNLIVRTIPREAQPSQRPSPLDTVAYGKYITTIAGCNDCHTPQEKGKPIAGLEFAGGFEFKAPFGTVRSANITPDESTGIGSWDRESFIAIFKAWSTPESHNVPVEQGAFNTPMPWTMYAGMTEEDLGAIYAYLRTVKPVTNTVERFTPKQ